MRFRRGVFAVAFTLLATIWVTPTDSRADEFSDGATRFIQNLTKSAVDSLAAKDITPGQREKLFGELLRQNFALDSISKWVLGRYWRKATPNERDRYRALFEKLLVKTYARRFGEYTNERLEIDSATNRGKGKAIVHSQLVRGEGIPSIRIEWRISFPGGRYKITDIVVEGVSLAQTQRSEFGSVIRRSGGKISGLITALEDKTSAIGTQTN